MEEYTNKVPVRIKSGHIEDEHIVAEAGGEFQKIPFESIEYICLGIIDEKLTTSDPPKSNMRNMIQGFFGGGDKSDKETKIQPTSRTTYILDIYVKNIPAPFRIDASSINYKGFIKKVTYISADNFKMLVHNICSKSENCRFNNALVTFLTKRKEKPQIFTSKNEFELVSIKKRHNLESEASWQELDFEAAVEPSFSEDNMDDVW